MVTRSVSFVLSKGIGRGYFLFGKTKSSHERFIYYDEINRQYPRNRLAYSARDFAAEKVVFPQEYFVYFKGERRISGVKDRWKTDVGAFGF